MTYEPPAGILIGPETMERVTAGDSIEEFLPNRLAEIGELGQGRSGPAIVPLGIVRTADPRTDSTFRQMLNVWISPEIQRRVNAGAQRESITRVRQALIVFPPRSAPERYRVLLNDEVVMRAAIRPSYPAAFKEVETGQQMTFQLRDMFDLREFALEGVDMEADGFAWLRQEGSGWALYFNFLPNSGLADKITESDRQRVMRSVQDAIAQELLRAFMRGVFTDDPGLRTVMAKDGWCPTPILLPEPWRTMCDAYRAGDPAAAQETALSAIGPEELDRLLATWVTVEPFASDRRFLETGIRHYKNSDFLSAVSVLLPRIEGLTNRVRDMRGIGARDSISKVFGALDQLASADVRNGFLATRIREEFEALITKFLFVHFRPSAPDAGAALGRHAHAHGATGDPYYDQPYALKIILALDALYFVAR